jgi:deoxyadenosine/deoxycytidine kinase
VEFRYLVVEGPPGVGKTALADRLGARLDAAVVLDDTENPFFADAQNGRPGAAFQAQLFALLARHRQQGALRQGDLFSQVTICDYLFDRDKIYAYLALDDNELFVYQRLYDLLVRDVPPPDAVVFLQAPADLLWKRLRQRARASPEVVLPSEREVREVADAYNHFFFHYAATPLLVVETSQVEPSWDDAAVDEVLQQLQSMPGGTRYFVPRAMP